MSLPNLSSSSRSTPSWGLNKLSSMSKCFLNLLANSWVKLDSLDTLSGSLCSTAINTLSLDIIILKPYAS